MVFCLGLYLFSLPQQGPTTGAVCLCLSILGAYLVFRMREREENLEDDARKAARRASLFEAEIRKQKEVVDALADGLNVAIFLCDPKTIIEYTNLKATELFQFDQPVGKAILSVTLSHELEEMVGKAAQSEGMLNAEITFRYPIDHVGLAQVWRDPTSEHRVFISIYDITHLRHLERARRDFVANVSHELRTPMTTIRAMSETLLEATPSELDEKKDRFLNQIISETDRLTVITQDLLTLSASESNAVDKHPCDLTELIYLALNQVQQKALDKDLKIEIDAPERLQIQANSYQIQQVLINLLDNAVNYTNEGLIELWVEVGGGEVTVTVKDSGIGIPHSHQSRIFERFYRVDKGRSRATGGTGLGLSIVKHIIEAHGGTIQLESEAGIGSQFSFTIPMR